MSDFALLAEILNKNYMANFPRDVAIYLEQIDPNLSAKILSQQSAEVLQRIWFYINSFTKENIFLLLPEEVAITLLEHMDVAPSAKLLYHLKPIQQEYYLSKLNKQYADYIREFMTYPEGSAANIMDKAVHVYKYDITVGELLQEMKKTKLTPSLYVYLIDDNNLITGRINIQALLVADDSQLLLSLSKKVPITLLAFSPRHEVLDTFEKSGMDSLPVVDSMNRVIGIVYATKVFEELKEEVTSDIQTMVGASPDETALSPSLYSVRLRLPWLLINLITAFIAAAVVGLFEGIIAKFTALAVLLPVVAGQSGNAGAQALAVSIRGLAIREISVTQWFRVVRKELIVGLTTGILISLVCSLGLYIWSKNYGLSLVLATSMVISVTIACVSGALVPIILKRLKQDPAQSSSIILTTVTDVIGFFSFLGIASILVDKL